MFKIKLAIQAANLTTSITVNNNTLTYNEVDYDFSALPDNSQVEGTEPAIGVIKKVDGVVEIELLYQYDSSLAESHQPASGDDLIIEIESGEVLAPIVWKEIKEDGENV